jgi:MFS transporter, ACS family, tartrate transporter
MPMNPTLETTTMRKVYTRLLPFSVLCMFVCYLDRVNVGFAALTMNKDLGLSAYFFGLGAGAFYGGYCLFEVPSNLVLERVGARFWLARIMITWGLFSGAMALASGPISFVVLRFMLGAAEAGFFPGILFYFHSWFPMRHRGRMISWFTVATPISVALGGPISTGLLGLNGVFGLRGWQWIFIVEAIPAIILGFVLLIYLRDRPSQADWLTDEEKEWLATELTHERREVERVRTYTLFQSLTDFRVLALAVIYFGIVTASVGLVIFVPQIIKQMGVSNLQTGFLTMIPYLVGTISMIVWGHVCDRMRERRWNLVIACLVGAVGLIVAGMLGRSFWALAAMCLATIGFYGSKGPFWPLPSTFLTGTAAAAGMTLINSVGNLGGFFGPFIVGWIKDSTGRFDNGLYALAGFMLLAAVVTVIGVQAPRRSGAPNLGVGASAGGAAPLKR